MRQLPLFSADAEASRRQREAYDLLLADYEEALARLDRARVEFRTLRQDRDGLQAHAQRLEDLAIKAMTCTDEARQERDQAWREYASAQIEARHWKSMYEIALLLRPQARTPAPPLEPTLKKLLLMSHPDKWSAGQPATELAHELSVTINRLREGQP